MQKNYPWNIVVLLKINKHSPFFFEIFLGRNWEAISTVFYICKKKQPPPSTKKPKHMKQSMEAHYLFKLTFGPIGKINLHVAAQMWAN